MKDLNHDSMPILRTMRLIPIKTFARSIPVMRPSETSQEHCAELSWRFNDLLRMCRIAAMIANE